MTTKTCKTCGKVAYVTNGQELFINGVRYPTPGEKAKVSFMHCKVNGFEGWVHWEKKS